MIFYKYGLLILIGITAGLVVAAGLFTFITLIGVLTRLAVRTNTANKLHLYEDLVVLGATIGNIVLIFEVNIPLGTVGLVMFGLFSGGFIGCLAVALEEVLKVFPVLTYRIRLKFGIPVIVLCLALGKGIGAFYQLFISGQ
ncbi:stage V sporulation protein AB [Anaerocolumna sp. AGMB13025]|uniref:stage V sporulation protein AB n=1 Tax=Anaerocolumna sp. AGMB13025 TaxID=3039116 RepID=UPI00241D8E16|nr:stage V sporulation protein AB [Anaerocolumna sp. AGMB13025]WFR58341.1 stage V sporulation protein AB [Anaerocolumna sp. AGMB13025]